ESGIDPIYDQLRGKTATAVTEIPVTQNSAHPQRLYALITRFIKFNSNEVKVSSNLCMIEFAIDD
ncbi:hypothetical protein, partial [Paraperlucidibaca baekdonensis]|uniref:hypothetical protein n=1 Tax=Paraperlucidibaca baekdonensis TaxID=748120 RepID=UPI001C6F1BF1